MSDSHGSSKMACLWLKDGYCVHGSSLSKTAKHIFIGTAAHKISYTLLSALTRQNCLYQLLLLQFGVALDVEVLADILELCHLQGMAYQIVRSKLGYMRMLTAKHCNDCGT